MVMRRRSTNVGVVEDVRQLDGISGGSRDVEHCRRNKSAAHVVRECRDDWEGSGQHARVGVCNAKEETWC